MCRSKKILRILAESVSGPNPCKLKFEKGRATNKWQQK